MLICGLKPMKKYVIKRDENSLPERLTRYRQELNEEQFRVVTAPPKASLVVAGAGTGSSPCAVFTRPLPVGSDPTLTVSP